MELDFDAVKSTSDCGQVYHRGAENRQTVLKRSALAADALFLIYLFLIYLCDGFLHEMEGSSLEPYKSYSYICAIGSCWRWSALIPARDTGEHVSESDRGEELLVRV